jgi:RNase P subunit RPR2
MIEVIGKDENLFKQVACKKCCSILKYTDGDVLRYGTRTGSRTSAIYHFITCPVCSNKVDVKSNK